MSSGPVDMRALRAVEETKDLADDQIQRWFYKRETEALQANNWPVWVLVCLDCGAVVADSMIDLRKHVAFHLRFAFADPDVPNVPAYIADVMRDPK